MKRLSLQAQTAQLLASTTPKKGSRTEQSNKAGVPYLSQISSGSRQKRNSPPKFKSPALFTSFTPSKNELPSEATPTKWMHASLGEISSPIQVGSSRFIGRLNLDSRSPLRKGLLQSMQSSHKLQQVIEPNTENSFETESETESEVEELTLLGVIAVLLVACDSNLFTCLLVLSKQVRKQLLAAISTGCGPIAQSFRTCYAGQL